MDKRIWSAATALQTRLVEVRQTLHRHPELSLEEHWTTAQIREWLSAAGIPVLPFDLPTGLIAEVRCAKPGPTVALRADIDALPVQEETGLHYASEIAGRMHACGHDFHTAVVLGAALVLQGLKDELAGTVRIFFQPAEENTHGARMLIGAGAMEGVQAVFGLHNKPDLAAGYVGVKPGPLMASADLIEITVTGKGGHAAIPNATIDPVVAGSAIVMALQTAVSRTVSPLEPAVVSVGSFQAGTAHNVIPSEALLRGTIRAFSPAVREQLRTLLTRMVREVAAGYGAAAEIRFVEGPPAVTNDPSMADLVRRSAERLGLPVAEAAQTTGAEDFAEYQQLAPGCFVWLGTGTAEGWHHPKFMVDESMIHKGSALFAQVAVDALASLAR